MKSRRDELVSSTEIFMSSVPVKGMLGDDCALGPLDFAELLPKGELQIWRGLPATEPLLNDSSHRQCHIFSPWFRSNVDTDGKPLGRSSRHEQRQRAIL